jgi:hypothetical protein
LRTWREEERRGEERRGEERRRRSRKRTGNFVLLEEEKKRGTRHTIPYLSI